MAPATYVALVSIATYVARDFQDNEATTGISAANVVGTRARPVMDEASNAAALAIESFQLTSMRCMTFARTARLPQLEHLRDSHTRLARETDFLRGQASEKIPPNDMGRASILPW